MRKTKYILGMVLSATLLFSGCMKEDIDELRAQQAENAARITALEEWQKTVNSNIASLQQLVMALENNDYVTGVVPFDTPAPGGYRITFSKSGEATIWNGQKGEQGETGATGTAGHSPAIGVKEFPAGSGVYYWTLDGEFITHDGTPSGNKMPVRGEKGDDGTTPTVEIGDNGNWIINGTDTGIKATGDPGQPGTTPTVEVGANGNWIINGVDTGVKATGDPGQPGADGKTPKVIIGTDGYWYYSADGTATGTPPAGTGWTPTNVKATGDKGDTGATGPAGPQGPQGDAIFAANGVDYSNDDYVVFTLADGPPATTITLPKYKSMGISFTQPTLFSAGTAQTLGYTITGTATPTNIRVVDVPAGWKVVVDVANTKFVITPPATFTAENFEGEATVLVGVGNEVSAMYTLKMRGAGFFKVGDYYPDPCAVYENGTLVSGTEAVGVVFWLSNHIVGDHPYDKVSANGKIVGLYERPAGFLDAEAMAWVANYGTTYNAGTDWYIPVYGEKDYYNLYCAYNGMAYEIWDTGKPINISKNYGDRALFRAKITDAGGDNITDSWYWISSVDRTNNAYRLHFNSGNVESSGDTLVSNKTRAIKSF